MKHSLVAKTTSIKKPNIWFNAAHKRFMKFSIKFVAKLSTKHTNLWNVKKTKLRTQTSPAAVTDSKYPCNTYLYY